MSSFFRSEEMHLCQLFIQSEAAYACISELGELGLVQFRDLNPNVNAFQRKFVNEIRRCDEMERKLRFIEKETKNADIKMIDAADNLEAPPPRQMIDLEAIFEKLHGELCEINNNEKELKKNYLELTELKHVLRRTQLFYDEQDSDNNSVTETTSETLVQHEAGNYPNTGHSPKLSFFAGVILRERVPAFERMLWRASHGNVYLRYAPIDVPLADLERNDSVVYKSVFIVYFQGEQLKTRVKKICDGFHATIYPCPEIAADRREMAMVLMTRIEDLNTILAQTKNHRYRILNSTARNIQGWLVKIRKIKAIYHTLNCCNVDVTQNCLIAECWIPLADIETVQRALKRGSEQSGSTVQTILNRIETIEDPPTFNRTNKFTSGFQTLIDAYGVANYREINPAPYTIITFPFLFAIMFGDIGHGLIIAMVGSLMVWKERQLIAQKINNEILNIFFHGRYIILLMGLFSIYTGLIYNDFFSKSLNIFGSRWRIPYNMSTIMSNKELQLNPGSRDAYLQTPYPFGLDPLWQAAKANKIIFLNAYKMKISIVFGVIHMIFGVLLSLFNHRHFRNRLAIIYEFIPQIIFLVIIFFYMVVLIFIKWSKYAASYEPPNSAGCAPSILITFINMLLLFKKPNKPLDGCEIYFYPGEQIIDKLFVTIGLLCIPWMLLGKPIHTMLARKREMKQQLHLRELIDNGEANLESDSKLNTEDGIHDEEEAMSEIFIHQIIHTIEYVLGCVSHTASYLRLWALSLAHAQLSDVLWFMVLGKIQLFPILAMPFFFVAFAVWATFTIAVLVIMEGLSAFLHTLRLHWVEFQSKFYAGSGYAFQPFHFQKLLETWNETSKSD